MTELKLYKFLNDHELEYRWKIYENKEDEFIVWIPFHLLEDFTKMIRYSYLCESGIEVNLQESCIALDLVPIAEYCDIELENILDKIKYKQLKINNKGVM